MRDLCRKYQIFALDCLPPQEKEAIEGADIHWFQVDIGHFDSLREVFYRIKEMDRVELLLHLAGYYDFTGEDHPEYTHTNVTGTKNLLELSASLNLKRFIFTSSVAACPFPKPGQSITENTPPTAPNHYARSKREGEEMIREYQDRVPACILRLAAIFSDWCEYGPLNNFFETWFSNGWNARILGGRGQWAVPYLHVQDLLLFYLRVIEKNDELSPLEVLQASPNGSTTHLELYREATRCYYGSPRFPVYVPKPMARLGISMRERAGRITGKMPFERAWMGDYIDLQLNVDSSQTHRRLDWMPRQELQILNRMSTMIHNIQNNPKEWERLSPLRKKLPRCNGQDNGRFRQRTHL